MAGGGFCDCSHTKRKECTRLAYAECAGQILRGRPTARPWHTMAGRGQGCRLRPAAPGDGARSKRDSPKQSSRSAPARHNRAVTNHRITIRLPPQDLLRIFRACAWAKSALRLPVAAQFSPPLAGQSAQIVHLVAFIHNFAAKNFFQHIL